MVEEEEVTSLCGESRLSRPEISVQQKRQGKGDHGRPQKRLKFTTVGENWGDPEPHVGGEGEVEDTEVKDVVESDHKTPTPLPQRVSGRLRGRRKLEQKQGFLKIPPPSQIAKSSEDFVPLSRPPLEGERVPEFLKRGYVPPLMITWTNEPPSPPETTLEGEKGEVELMPSVPKLLKLAANPAMKTTLKANPNRSEEKKLANRQPRSPENNPNSRGQCECITKFYEGGGGRSCEPSWAL